MEKVEQGDTVEFLTNTGNNFVDMVFTVYTDKGYDLVETVSGLTVPLDTVTLVAKFNK